MSDDSCVTCKQLFGCFAEPALRRGLDGTSNQTVVTLRPTYLGSLGPYLFSSIFNRIYVDVRLVQDARKRLTKYVDPTRVRRDTKNIFNRINAVPK